MRPKVNEALCFVCQILEPEFIVNNGVEEFKVCSLCSEAIAVVERQHNAIKMALYASKGGTILRMMLGANLTPTHFTYKKIEKEAPNG